MSHSERQNSTQQTLSLRPLTLVGIIISIATGTSLGVLAHIKTRAADTPPQTLRSALEHVSSAYVEEIDQQELLDSAIDGIMHGLDDHSTYLNPKAFKDLEASTTGQFGGIGIELGLVDGFFTVVAPMDGTPADLVGLEAGDRITALDGDPVKGKKLVDIIKILRGEPGSGVLMQIQRDEDSLEFSIEREVISVTSVRSRLLEPGYGYIRISQFQTTTAHDVDNALYKLVEEELGPLKGLVLDLRNNPGGTLQSSVKVSDYFLESGIIVSTKGRLKSSHAKHAATSGDKLDGAPIVVLINGGSASASEIVAGALQDHNRATLMGSTSYGKGSVQSVIPLNDAQALKLTTAYYYTPNGRSIHKKGIEPDIEIDADEESVLDQAIQTLKQHADTTPIAYADDS